MKPLSKKLDDQSVESGRTMKQIAEQRDAEWQSNREEKKKKPASKRKVARRAKTMSLPNDLPPAKARFIEPMKAKLMSTPPPGEWSYELKFDGIRLLAVKNRAAVNLISRNRNELAARFGAHAIQLGAAEASRIERAKKRPDQQVFSLVVQPLPEGRRLSIAQLKMQAVHKSLEGPLAAARREDLILRTTVKQ